VLSVGLHGLDAELIRVGAVVDDGPGSFQLEGLPESRARETRVRVRAALQQVGLDLQEHAVTRSAHRAPPGSAP
jgi:magnesium chelatase family protein